MTGSRSIRTGINSLIAISAVLAACTPLASQDRIATRPIPSGPAAGDVDLSPFYRVERTALPQAGSVLRSEAIAAQQEMPHVGEAHRLLYVSEDARWKSGAIPVSGVLFLPAGTPPPQGWPLLSWGHGTLGISDICAPSWTGFRPRDAAYLDRWLAEGFAVVASDYQGLGGPGPHPYHHWQSEGRSVLDAARAALAFRPQSISNRVIFSGQSQGSAAVLGAAMLATDYAPDVKLLGVIASGLTSDFPDGPILLPARETDTMLLDVAAAGLRDDAPPVEDIMTPAGRELLAAARSGCTREVKMRARDLKLRDISQAFAIPMKDVEALRIPLKDMPQKKLGIPIFLATGLADRTTLPRRQYAGAKALCVAGNAVTWKTYTGLGHDGALHGSFEDALGFARALLAGETGKSACDEMAEPGEPGELNPAAPFNDD